MPMAPQPEVLRCGCADGQLMMQQELLQRQQLLQQQQALQQQALLREQQLQETQKQCEQHQPQPQPDQRKGYSTCGGEDGVLPAGPLFVEKMSLLMEQLATCGDESSRRMSVATRFDSICAPATSISAYIPRLYRHFRCSEEVFVFALIYLDRVIRANHIKINALNIHRLVLAASVIGVKFVEDVRYSNRYYARVGGVGLAELNRLELAFLKLVKFDLTVSKEEYAVYRSTVLLACPKRPVASPSAPDAYQQQTQHKESSHMAADGVRCMETDTASADSAPATQQNSQDVPDLTEQQKALQVLMLQKGNASGFWGISSASTVTTTLDTGPSNLPSSGRVRAAAVAGDPSQQEQLKEYAEVALQRQALLQQEDVLRQQQGIDPQQWQSGGVRIAGVRPQLQLPRLTLQQTHLVLDSQQYQTAYWDCTNMQNPKLSKQLNRMRSQERLLELQQQHQRQLARAQQLLLLREYHHQQHLLLEQQQQQQLQLLRQQQQLLLQEGDFMVNEASLSPSNSFTPTSRSCSRDSLPGCGGFGMEPEDKMTTAASDEELQLASPMSGLREVLTAEVP